jgi:hypothetical protein
MGSSLYASSAQHERLQIPFGLGNARQQARERIYTTSSWLKGQDSFTTPAVLDSSIPFSYTCSSRPPSMIQGTGAVWMRGGGACAVLVTVLVSLADFNSSWWRRCVGACAVLVSFPIQHPIVGRAAEKFTCVALNPVVLKPSTVCNVTKEEPCQ